MLRKPEIPPARPAASAYVEVPVLGMICRAMVTIMSPGANPPPGDSKLVVLIVCDLRSATLNLLRST